MSSVASRIRRTFAVSLLLFAAHTRGAEVNPKVAAENLQAEIYLLLDADVTVVRFSPGSATLGAADKADLRSLVDATRADGSPVTFVVAAWSDREYSDTTTQKLSHGEKQLANERKDGIYEVLKNSGAQLVDTYSFAEHPNWLAKVFNTKQAKLKGEGKIKTADDQVIADMGKRLRDMGGPGTGVIIVKSSGELATH